MIFNSQIRKYIKQMLAEIKDKRTNLLPWIGDGQGDLVCCSSWGRKESDTAEWLNWTELIAMDEVSKICKWSRKKS